MVRPEAVVGTDLLVLRSTRDVRAPLRSAREAGALSGGPCRILLLSDGDLTDLERACRLLALTLRDVPGEVRVLVRKQALADALFELRSELYWETLWILPEDRLQIPGEDVHDVRLLEPALVGVGTSN